MVEVLYGTESFLINEYLEKIKRERQIENIIKYNLEETTLMDIIEDALYIDLFNNDKMIIVYNSYFLNDLSMDTTILEDYFNHKNEKTLLFFISDKEKLDERKKIVKLFKKENKIKQFNKLEEKTLEEKIKEKLKSQNFEIDFLALKELINRCKNNYQDILNEINKLILYKDNEKNITIEDVKKVVSKPLEDNIFKLLGAITENNKKQIFDIYEDILNTGEDPIKILVMIANEFRLIYEVKIMNNLNEQELSTIMKIHPYRIKKAKEKTYSYTKEKLEIILNKLSDLDYNIKSGNVDKYAGLELFLIEY